VGPSRKPIIVKHSPDRRIKNRMISRSHTSTREIFHYGSVCTWPVAYPYQGSDPTTQPTRKTIISPLRRVSTMAANLSQRPKGREAALSSLNIAIEVLNLAKEATSFMPANAVFGSVSILLTTIRVGFSPSDWVFHHVNVWPGLDAQ